MTNAVLSRYRLNTLVGIGEIDCDPLYSKRLAIMSNRPALCLNGTLCRGRSWEDNGR
ncbi:hypothetical protein HQN89_23515 [Paenibacillus frigoriresistens]|uniref:hypothetical protein n=1 Tax=Paenibacillus alginolyticus TaxID=59839 RepID=UPI0015634E7B|nr:hypothetical protein [Paenibacillus frigoriresistens]NRF93911.1 hypothetical protein [Paenibacillus frigoriresistens]